MSASLHTGRPSATANELTDGGSRHILGRMHEPSVEATPHASFDLLDANTSRITAPLLFILSAAVVLGCSAAELRVGTASIGITPDRPVALDGQFETRISRGVDNPITATAVALEAREGNRVIDQAILLSADLVVFGCVAEASVVDRCGEADEVPRSTAPVVVMACWLSRVGKLWAVAGPAWVRRNK